jgi:hypothetical protein
VSDEYGRDTREDEELSDPIDGTGSPESEVYDWCGPMCRCGSRNTARVGESALQRMCLTCSRTFAWRVTGGHLVPMSLEMAMLLDESRRA